MTASSWLVTGKCGVAGAHEGANLSSMMPDTGCPMPDFMVDVLRFRIDFIRHPGTGIRHLVNARQRLSTGSAAHRDSSGSHLFPIFPVDAPSSFCYVQYILNELLHN